MVTITVTLNLPFKKIVNSVNVFMSESEYLEMESKFICVL